MLAFFQKSNFLEFEDSIRWQMRLVHGRALQRLISSTDAVPSIDSLTSSAGILAINDE